MSVRRLSEDQPEGFAFSSENAAWARERIAKYPEGKQASAVIPLLWRAQEQHDGWLPEPAIRHVAELLDMAFIRVYEVATFYTMFNLAPIGKHFVQLCGTTPCWLRGAEALKDVCREEIGSERQISDDGMLSWLEVECLGACVNAPMVQINADYYEDLDAETFKALLDKLRNGEEVKPGPQVPRQSSCPLSGPTSLAEGMNGATVPDATYAEPQDDDKPEALKRPRRGGADDLNRIPGVSKPIAEQLNELGIYHYQQVAAWSEANIAWLDATLRLRGRILREDWVGEAGMLQTEERR